MSFVNRPGMGTLFPNEKEKESQPDYRGSLTLASGEVVKFAGWKKQGAKGPYLSLKIDKPREDDFRSSSAGPVAGGERDRASFDLDDEIPF